MESYSIEKDNLTVEKNLRRGRKRRCGCGCGKAATHYLAAGGCNMGWAGCELSVWRTRKKMQDRFGKKPKG